MDYQRTQEQHDSQAISEDEFTYFGYRLSRAVICTLGFRDFITQKDQAARVAPVKSGDGHKFTIEGILKVPKGFDPHICTRFRKAKIVYSAATLADFNKVVQQARIKVFFRGFALGTRTEDIRRFFSFFGRVEYLYLMASSKNGINQNFIQGYFIYSSNEEAEYLLSQKHAHVFRGSKICCQIYIGNKKKKRSSENKGSKTDSPFEDSASVAHSSNNLDLYSKVSKKFGGIGDRIDKIGNIQTIPNVMNENHAFLNSDNRFKRPFLLNLDHVKSNSKEPTNIRFNICKRTQLLVSNRSSS